MSATCENEGNIPIEFCTCDPITSELVSQYLPELVAQYAPLTAEELGEDSLAVVVEHLLAGELDQARALLNDWAYELHGNDLTDIYVCGDCGLQYIESEGALSIDSDTHTSFTCNACLLHTA